MSHHLLVVEDDPDLRSLVELALGSQGYSVESARNGLDGLQMALSGPPRLIITDVRMPSMDGIALFTEMRKHQRLASVPVIFYTAFAEDERLADMRKALGVEVLRKEGPTSSLKDAVARLLAEKEAITPEAPSAA